MGVFLKFFNFSLAINIQRQNIYIFFSKKIIWIFTYDSSTTLKKYFLPSRFDESINYVELDYPRDMSMFAGVGYNIDAVFQWKNGN